LAFLPSRKRKGERGLTHDIGGTGGVRCVNETLENLKPFGTWRKRLTAYAETCRDWRSTDATRVGVLDTPLTPSLYSERRGVA